MLKPLTDKFADFAVSFYEWGAGWTGKLSGFFRLAPLSYVLTRHLSKRPARLGVELLVALSLTVTFYFLVPPPACPIATGTRYPSPCSVTCRNTSVLRPKNRSS